MTPIEAITHCIDELNNIILGKEQETKLALACALAEGHLLIEDIPGMGKTTLSHALASVLGLSYKRAQFTSDMLPSDILGGNIFDRNTSQFVYQEGPVFSNVLLADEINRAPPKTQSALLEAMEERQVSQDGQTRPLPKPFFVIATQNPMEQAGTFALPESQLDRFMMRISLGYPSADAEKSLLAGEPRANLVANLKPKLSADALIKIQKLVKRVACSQSIIEYVYRLISVSRKLDSNAGLSPRAALALLSAAKAWAFIDGRTHVLPDDVQAVFPYVCDHRTSQTSNDQEKTSLKILKTVDIF